MSSSSNPFSLVYDELWSMLEEDDRFDIKTNNKIKYNGSDRDPHKSQTSTSDYPEVTLITENVSGNLCNTSSTSMLRRNYSWIIASGDLRYSEIFPVEWAIFTGMLAWRHRLTILEWENTRFVARANLNDSNFDQVENLRRRGLKGWVAVWSIYVDMHFNTADLEGSHLS